MTKSVAGKKEERATQILQILLEKGRKNIDELAVAVGTSSGSVRRDLIKLEERGLVLLKHGGAEVAGNMAHEPIRSDAASPLREQRVVNQKRGRVLAAAETTAVVGNKRDRATQILRVLLQQGRKSIEELAAAVGTSPASVRRDLIKLEERGLVHRKYGGAEVAGKMAYEPFRFDAAFPLRQERFADEKRRIALAAAEMVVDGETVALSPGTTTTQIARSLRHRDGIHIVTSAVNIGIELSSLPNMRVTLTGGAIRWPGSFSMVGVTAFDGLQRMFFDKLFLGACGIHPQDGLTVIEPDEALILGEMVRRTKQVIAVADASKIGMTSSIQVCGWEKIHTILTDQSADAKVVAAFVQQGIKVVMV